MNLTTTHFSQVTVGVKQSSGELISMSENLSANHLRLTTADIANTGNGDIMIATSDGQLSSAVQCFLVSVKLEARNMEIHCKNAASLYTKTQVDYNPDTHCPRWVLAVNLMGCLIQLQGYNYVETYSSMLGVVNSKMQRFLLHNITNQ